MSQHENRMMRRIILCHASDIPMREVSWLWDKRFAKGKISIIAGEPGLGKSQVSISMAANITQGRPWPDKVKCEVGEVVFLSAEDDPTDTIVPRLKAAGADCSRVHFVDAVSAIKADGSTLIDYFSIATDIGSLEHMLENNNRISVIFIDPLSSYLGANIDENKNAAVRSVLRPLSKLAEKYNVAIICVAHLNKNEAQSTMNRVSGSIAFVAAARSVFIVLKDEDDRNKRLFLPIKNNIGNDKTGLSFHIENFELKEKIMAPRVVWSDLIVTKHADEIMSSRVYNNEKSARADAKEFLLDILSNGKMNVTDIFEQAALEGIAVTTLRRAKSDMGVLKGRDGFGAGSKSYWYLLDN